MLTLVNRERAAAGCPALRWDDRLGVAARAHSVDMAARNYFSHTSLDGRSSADRMRAQGYPKPGGENIGAGYRTPEAAMKGWMNSSGHRANVLDCRYQALGVGVGKGGKWGIYWTQNFGF
ncbi:Cysteine-rich secretory protein family protein [Actinokineospora alba]|uniref:Cysteine-rich secretory protein family protein n=1 Tax=Actinokineospora alba TaxID=504798 RepID=A0A1H0F477_9PSEU|nr:CAP domain-containing protein [Actinokineospora alba]SDI19029.1 Cysteine-rich secretory protein family protein [Actinokineospora alba]SDN89467.1 Cysteine-rich secretory protein family protein [Actinokineospora alba]